MAKTFLMRIPVTVQEEGSTALPVFNTVEIRCEGPDDATPEELTRAFAYQLGQATASAISDGHLPRS